MNVEHHNVKEKQYLSLLDHYYCWKKALASPLFLDEIAKKREIDFTIEVFWDDWPTISLDCSLANTSRGVFYQAGRKLVWSHFVDFIAVFDERRKRCELYCQREQVNESKFFSLIFPYIMNIVLSYQEYHLIHCSAAIWSNRLWLMVGKTGVGKSTIVDWLMKEGAIFVCDDKLIVGKRRMVPFWGESNKVLSRDDRKMTILFPQKSDRHCVRSLSPAEALVRLSHSTLFPNFESILKRSFDFLSSLIEESECYLWQYCERESLEENRKRFFYEFSKI